MWRLRHYWMFISNPSRELRRAHSVVRTPPRTYRTKCAHHTYNTTGKKKKETHLVQSLAPALTLTLTLNRLANKPQQTTSTLFSLMYQVHDGLLQHTWTTNYLWIFNRRRNDDVMQHELLRIPDSYPLVIRPWSTPLPWWSTPLLCPLVLSVAVYDERLEDSVAPRWYELWEWNKIEGILNLFLHSAPCTKGEPIKWAFPVL